ncbi:MAG: polysaccharide deacetylase family protein [Bauldia sp.]
MSRAKVFARKAALNTLAVTGAHRLFGNSAAGLGAVLMFHHVRPDTAGDFAPNAHLEVTPQFLETAIVRSRQLGYEIVDLDEAMRRIATKSGPPFVVLTFDDGYRDNFTEAYPVLKRLEAPFTVYVATGLVDRSAPLWWTVLERVIERQEAIALDTGNGVGYFASRTVSEKRDAFDRIQRWLVAGDEDVQRAAIRDLAWRYGVDPKAISDAEMMSWDEVKTLAADPLATIGGHTVGHYALAKLPLPRAKAEVRDGARVLEAVTGRAPRHFAYPYGYPSAAGEREFALLAELGFATAVTTRPGVISPAATTPTALPRVSMNGLYQSQRYLDVLLSGVPFLGPGRFLRLAAGRAAAGARAAAGRIAPSRRSG